LNDAWDLNSVQLNGYISVGWMFDAWRFDGCPFKKCCIPKLPPDYSGIVQLPSLRRSGKNARPLLPSVKAKPAAAREE
jgi:hypothetical protein